MTELYRLMVPDTEINAFTSGERKWYPIGFGVGAGLIFGLGSAFLVGSITPRRNYND